MKKSSWIYVALLVFIALGSVVDVAIASYGPMVTSWSGIIQGFLIVLFIYWWEAVDAVERGCRHSGVAKLVTIFLAPVGHGIYLYQSREWKAATWLFVRYWAGMVVTFGIAGTVAALIVDPASLTV